MKNRQRKTRSLLARHSRGKGTEYRAILAFAMAACMTDIMAVRLQETVIDATILRHYRLVHS